MRHILTIVVTYAVAVLLAVAAGAIACLLSGCSTTFYSSTTGMPLARFSGDMTGSEWNCAADGSQRWSVSFLNHSTPTTAAGAAIRDNLAAAGTAAAAATAIPAAVK